MTWVGWERWRAIAAAVSAAGWLVALGACEMKTHQQQQVAAETNWKDVRADLKHQLAIQHFQAGRFEEAESAAREVIGLNPRHVDGYILLVRALLENGDRTAARRVLQVASELGLESPEFSYLRGIIAERRRQLAEAIEHYRDARRQSPNDKAYWLAEAECLAGMGQPEAAIRLIEPQLAAQESDGSLEILLAKLEMLCSNPEAGIEAYRRAVSMVKDESVVAEEFGLLLMANGEYAEALMLLQPLVDDPKVEASGPAMRAAARCNIELNRLDRAEALLADRLNEHPDDALAWLLRSRTAMLAEQFPAARRYAEDALRFESDHAEALLMHGFACLRTDDAKAARQSAARVLELKPADALAHCLMGESLAADGQAEGAVEHWQRALQIDPDLDWVRARLSAVRDLEQRHAATP